MDQDPPVGPVDAEVYYCDRDTATATGHYLTNMEWSFIVKHLSHPSVRKHRIIDVGGGSGRFALPLFLSGMNVVVEEVNALPLRLLRQKNRSIPAIRLDPAMRSFPFRNRSADCMLCIEVPDLIESEWFFHEAHRIIDRKGGLIFTAHNRRSYKGFYKKNLLQEDKKSDDWYRIHYRSNFSQVKERLNRTGFKLIDALGFHWIPVSRASNNILIPLFAAIEKILNLGACPSLSPWILAMAQKV